MNDVVKDNNLVYVTGLSSGDSYGWSELEIYYSKEKDRFFWIEGSGCSCSWLWEDVRNLSDMCDGNRKNAADAARRFAKETFDYNGDIATSAKGVLGFKK